MENLLNDDSLEKIKNLNQDEDWFDLTESDMVWTWTECQEKAIIDVNKWIKDREKLFYTLAGSAGTGKTTVLKAILAESDIKYGRIVSAPTHQACKVIEKTTGISSETIQKLLGLRPNFDIEKVDINNIKFDTKTKPQIGLYQLLIIDEASMINDDLFYLIKQQARKFKTKVLFVGDKLQLPPVKQYKGLVFDKSEIQDISILKTPARQSPDNPLQVLLQALRNDIEHNELNFKYLIDTVKLFKLDKKLPSLIDKLRAKPKSTFKTIRNHFPDFVQENGIKGYTTITDKNKILDFISDHYTKLDIEDTYNDCKVVAFTNDVVGSWAKNLRNRINLDCKDPLEKGDYLISYTNYSTWPDKEIILMNSGNYIVHAIEKTISEEGINGWDVELLQIDDPLKRWSRIFVVDPNDYNRFNRLHIKYVKAPYNDKKNWSSRWKEYFYFKNQHMVLNNLNKVYENISLPSKDLEYGFACTIHKAQGSTFNIVIIDGNDIQKAFKIGLPTTGKATNEEKQRAREFAYRLMYVALSRAKNFAIIYF